MLEQISEYINYLLSSYLCSYRQDISTHQAILGLTEEWKVMLDRNGYTRAVLMDLSKAFDTINDDLLIAKTKC